MSRRSRERAASGRTSPRHVVQTFALATLLSACCFGRQWSPANTAAEISFAMLASVDGLQSRNAVQVCAESNPVIGPCGDRVPPPVYYPVAIAAHALAALLMPPRWRPWFQGFSVGAEAAQVRENYALEYHVDGTYGGGRRF